MINIEYLQKVAADYEYKDYQQRVIDKVNDPEGPHGIIALHSMGSGKTLTALGALDKALKGNKKARGLYIMPAPLVARTPEEMFKYNLGHLKDKVDVISYEQASKLPPKLVNTKYNLIAVDEAHRLRNGRSQRAQNIQQLLNNSDKVLLLTGTAGYNHPADMYALINRINPELRLPEDHVNFAARYIDPDSWDLRHKREVSKILNKYVDKYEVEKNNEHFPSSSTFVIHVPMSNTQENIYRYVEKDLPGNLARKVRENLPMDIEEATALNFFSGDVRQAANTPTRYDVSTSYKDSPKINAALNNLKEQASKVKNFRGIVYSNYLESGINPYAEGLKANGITPFIYTGKTPVKEKELIIKEYNKKDNKPKVLMLSSAGGEGLDLKRTNLMQVLEPHFNEPKLNQVKARAIRYDSHADLPKDQRNVLIEEYRSAYPKGSKYYGKNTIDDALSELAAKKQHVVTQMTDLIGRPAPEDTFMDKLRDWNPWDNSRYKNFGERLGL